MPRAISIGSALVALVFLVLVLADATLVDRRPPSVTAVRLSATAGGDRIAEPISSINVVFSEPVRTATAETRFHLAPAVAGALTWDGPTLIFTPSEPMPPETDFVVRVEPGFIDLAGNVATSGIDEWAFATAGPPRIVIVDPPDGATGIATDAVVSLAFDRLMDTASVETAIAIDPVVPFDATWSGASVSLSFAAGLALGTSYTLLVDVSAADTAGAHLAIPFQTRFSTVSAGFVGRVVPAPDVAGVSIHSPIAVFFAGPIDPSTIQDAISIVPSVSGQTEVLANPAGAPQNVLVFRPSSPLEESTTYAVTLLPIVRELGDPSTVAAGRTWSFTTGALTESVQNQIVFTSDRSGVANVWVVNPDGTSERQLTWALDPVTGYDVTGDGRRLVYAAGGAVTTVNVDGEDLQVVTDTGDQESLPRLSPNETEILLARRDASGTDLGWWLVPTPGTFGDERQILAVGPPAVIPNGTVRVVPPAFDQSGRFALLPAQPDGALVVVDLVAGSDGLPPAIATGVAPNGRPAWSSASGTFVVTGHSDAIDTSGVHRIGVDGSVTLIPGVFKAAGDIAVDETGRLVFAIDLGGAGRFLVLLGPGPSDSKDVTDDQAYVDLGATFSPDGSRVVVARALRDSEVSAGLWLIGLGDGSLTQLTVDGGDPRWLP